MSPIKSLYVLKKLKNACAYPIKFDNLAYEELNKFHISVVHLENQLKEDDSEKLEAILWAQKYVLPKQKWVILDRPIPRRLRRTSILSLVCLEAKS